MSDSTVKSWFAGTCRVSGAHLAAARPEQLSCSFRHLVERIEGEAFWLVCPGFAHKLVWGEPLQRLEPTGEVVGAH